jgi:hypothetical protein
MDWLDGSVWKSESSSHLSGSKVFQQCNKLLQMQLVPVRPRNNLNEIRIYQFPVKTPWQSDAINLVIQDSSLSHVDARNLFYLELRFCSVWNHPARDSTT